MKHSNIIIAILFVTICCGGFSSCKKDDYLTDGGVSKIVSNLSTYDYLHATQYKQFDTTLLIIDHFNLKDSVNKAGTFFAFTNYSVRLLMNTLQVRSLDELYDTVSSKLITQYMFSSQQVNLEKATLVAQQFPNWAGTVAPSGFKKIQGTYSVYLVSSAPSFNYFTLQYVKINGAPDEADGPGPGDLVDATLSCQTSGIQTATGTTLHVLANNAVLNRL